MIIIVKLKLNILIYLGLKYNNFNNINIIIEEKIYINLFRKNFIPINYICLKYRIYPP